MVKRLESLWPVLFTKINKVRDDAICIFYMQNSLIKIEHSKFSVYLIDDVLASLDAHVAKHIVKHCILELLKDRTRILVTENRTLFYYSNQILHVEAGKVTTSDYALGSIESDHFESSESASSDELHTPVSFELNYDDSSDRDKSIFEVSSGQAFWLYFSF